jgi:hypothetical protein
MTDTTTEAVERLAEGCRLIGHHFDNLHDNHGVNIALGAAATLRALAAERDAALAQVAGAYADAAKIVADSYIKEVVSLRTPADALAARDRRDAQMRAEGMREVETKLKAMIAGFRHGLDPEGCSYDAGIRDVLDKLAAILAAAEKEAGNG